MITAETAAVRDVRPPAALSLDALLDLAVPELQKLYAAASVPAIGEVEGALRGRMLATTVLRGRAASLVRRWAGSGSFPWRGKSFAPHGETEGEGINRIFRDSIRRYRFETYVGKSRAGDFDALQLDYDLPENPFFIRPIKDEIRRVAPGLFLGQAYLQTRRDPHLVLYFGLSS